MSDAQLIDELCEVCVQLVEIVRRQSEILAQDKVVEDALGRLGKIVNIEMQRSRIMYEDNIYVKNYEAIKKLTGDIGVQLMSRNDRDLLGI